MDILRRSDPTSYLIAATLSSSEATRNRQKKLHQPTDLMTILCWNNERLLVAAVHLEHSAIHISVSRQLPWKSASRISTWSPPLPFWLRKKSGYLKIGR